MITALDQAHARMMERDEDEQARRAFFAALAAAELFIPLQDEGGDRTIRPLILETGEGKLALAFDTESRMGDFLPEGTAYATLAGRQLAAMLAEAGIGLGLNLEVAPSAILLPAEAIAWMADLGSGPPQVHETGLGGIRPPADLPDGLLDVLDQRLPLLAGIASTAWLVRGPEGLVLALSDVPEAAEPACSAAIGEALNIAGLQDFTLDIAFVSADSAIAAELGRVGLRIDLPVPAKKSPRTPGSDPNRPPKLV